MGSAVMEPQDFASYARIYHPGENYSSLCLSTGKINSRGLFHDTNPLDYSLPLLMAQLSLASFAILCTSCLLKPLGQPSMIIQIIGGLILGPSFLGRIPDFTASFYPFEGLFVLDGLATFGYMFYFFLIGVQMDPWIMKNIRKKDIFIGISTISLPMALSLPTSSFLLTSFSISKNIAASLKPVAAVSSLINFPVVAQYLNELKMLNSEFGRTALSVSLISNLSSTVLEIIALIAQQDANNMFHSLQMILAAVSFVLVMVFVVRPIILWAMKGSYEGKPLKEGFICMVILGVVVTGFCSKALGTNIFFGPLIYGIIIPAGPPLGSALMEKLDLITSWVFMPLYFVKNGLVIDIFSVRFRDYCVVQFIILLACFGKFFGALISSVLCKVKIKEAIQIGLVMNVQGLLDLGMFKLMKQGQAIEEEPFVTLCLSMLIVTASITPMLSRLYDPLRRHTVQRRKTIMDMTPDSELRVLTCVHDQEDVPSIINLVDNLNPSKHSPIQIFLLHLVELVGRAHPILIHHQLNSVISSAKTSASRSIFNAFKHFQQGHSHGAVTVNPFTAISSYETMHDEVCEMAINREISLIVTPFHKRDAETGIVESSEAGSKMMNEKILEMAPCTVGIIVSHRSHAASRSDVESCHLRNVAVFFIGGPDDWEALAIGAKMVFRQNISLTVVRVFAETASVGVRESYILDEFKRLVEGNHNVLYVEKEARDGAGVAAVVRAVEDDYELIIVGRNHDPKSPLMQGLLAWNDYSELGAIGDLFASDSHSHSSILVVQQQNEV